MKLKRYSAPIIVMLALTLTACLHKSGGTKVTAWERVHTYNAVFAETNQSVEQGAEAAVNSGLWPAVQAAPLIGWTGQVASLHQQVTAVLQKGTATDADIASIRSLLQQIKDASGREK